MQARWKQVDIVGCCLRSKAQSKVSRMFRGPLVYGICYCPVENNELLKEMGLADSKTLSEEQRESMFEKISEARDTVGWIVEIISPTVICNKMLQRTKYNLNFLSHDSAIGLVQRALDKGVNLKEVYVDTVGPPETYQAKLQRIFPNLDITVAKKADATYPIVSGASICAKIARDKAVKCWEFAEGIDTESLNYGSGYPGDPKTKAFLQTSMDKVFGFPQFVRFSWSTASVILEKEAMAVRWDDDDEDDKDKTGSASISSFFSKKNDNPKLHKHRFFSERSLSQVTTL
ncbi:ribonuclease H2 subunit A-like isoform X2 [Gigantopelta aegis]|uniref:ribonuclease H2 subunit A-like isoform X2 n=1 Tax=Gigantopelta aegis TaxID=1735272 RepID=UPI001B88B093|nr:ribonuclease H2 subunit A-like isoform X2 [Gigantopelta aegis]